MSGFDRGLLDPSTGAASAVDDAAVLAAIVDVEAAHLAALVGAGVAGEKVRWDAADLDLPGLAAAGAAGGNPVIPLVAELRRRTPGALADVVHLGLTSQDVLDSALMLVAGRAITAARPSITSARDGLAAVARRHRDDPVPGRTLGRQAAPTTIGLRLAVLLDGIDRTWRHLLALERPLQLGGSVGTLAVLVDRLGEEGTVTLRADVAARLGLTAREGVWHVERSPVALLGAGIAAVVGALSRLGLEVVASSRDEVGELGLTLPEGAGGSSAMPQKQNPVPAVLLIANARRAPSLAATLLAAQLAPDERPPGDWHAEWQPFRELLRLLLESAALAAQVAAALTADPERALANLGLTHGAIHAERAQQVLAAALGRRRAAELVRAALSEPEFVAAIRDAAAGEVPADVLTRLVAATTPGPVGLSTRLVDAIAGAS